METLYLTISDELKDVEEVLFNSVSSSGVSTVREIAKYTINGGGKRFRPALAILSAKISGYSGDNVPHLAAAIELIHTSSIMHDDVLDNAEQRRGLTSTNKKWGNHLSILVGDYCFSLASEILASHTNPHVISILSKAIKETTEGEVLEVVNSNNVLINIDAYMKIIDYKTARLISASCEAASVLAEAPPKHVLALKNYGQNLGLAFQITDDILDYTSSDDTFGKDQGTDLREGKLTLPIIYAFERADTGEKETLKETLLSQTCSKDLFLRVYDILRRYGCIEDAQKVAKRYANQAIQDLDYFKPSIHKETLVKLANQIIDRKL